MAVLKEICSHCGMPAERTTSHFLQDGWLCVRPTQAQDGLINAIGHENAHGTLIWELAEQRKLLVEAVALLKTISSSSNMKYVAERHATENERLRNEVEFQKTRGNELELRLTRAVERLEAKKV